MSQVSKKAVMGIFAISVIALIVGLYGIYYASTLSGTLAGISKSLEAQSTKIDEVLSRLKIAEENIKDIAEVTGVPIGKPEELKAIIEHKKLVEAAKKEGKLVIYTTDPVAIITGKIEKFKAEYPFMEVEYYRGTSEKIFEKIIAEQKAGKFLADVYLVGDVYLAHELAVKYKAFEPYTAPRVKEVPAFQPPELEGLSHYESAIDIVWLYNTKLVKKEELPKSVWDIVTDPRWKGKKIGIETACPWFSVLYDKLGKEKAIEWAKKLLAQEPMFVAGHTTLSKKVAAGELHIGLSYRHHADKWRIEKGEPIDWFVPEDFPVVRYLKTLAILKNAPHPNAAKLWIQWELSKTGQRLVYDIGYYTPIDPAAMPEHLKKLDYIPLDLSLVKRVPRDVWYLLFFKEIFGIA